jgi:prefoldin beta subunit
MDLDKDTQEKIQQLQILEQNSHSILMQKQAFQIEQNETENAILEVKKSTDDIYKLVGKIMLKVNKDDIEKELIKKKDLLSLRLKSIEKQESNISKQIDEIKEEVMKKLG